MTRSLRARLVAGFAATMLVVLVAAGAYVYWRVQFALDHRLNQDLAADVSDLRAAAARQTPATALAVLRDEARSAQILGRDGTVLASGPGVPRGMALLTPAQAARARRGRVHASRGGILSPRGRHLRITAVPVPSGAGEVAVSAVRLDQRDEALRELFGSLVVANLLALGLASAVGYRLSRRALAPVEEYRAQATRIAAGATGVRLDVAPPPRDEIARLGATLNDMLDAQELAATRQQQFIDDASHELRTPLAALAAEIDLALRKPRSTAEYEAALQRLSADTAALADLAAALLDLGTLGSAAPAAREVDLRAAVEQAARRARGQLDDGAARSVGAAASAATAHADPALLERALGNLVDNSVRHGAGDIAIDAADVDGCVVVAVHDDGHLAPGFLAHAAERLRQGDVSRAGGGVGLGLAIVDAIMSAHRGQLRVCSDGHHHHHRSDGTAVDAVGCRHRDAGVTVSLVFPPIWTS